jgi:hypothetical protein
MDPVVQSCDEVSTNRNAIETMHRETALSNAVLSSEEDNLQTKHIKKRNENNLARQASERVIRHKIDLAIVSIL